MSDDYRVYGKAHRSVRTNWVRGVHLNAALTHLEHLEHHPNDAAARARLKAHHRHIRTPWRSPLWDASAGLTQVEPWEVTMLRRERDQAFEFIEDSDNGPEFKAWKVR